MTAPMSNFTNEMRIRTQIITLQSVEVAALKTLNHASTTDPQLRQILQLFADNIAVEIKEMRGKLEDKT